MRDVYLVRCSAKYDYFFIFVNSDLLPLSSVLCAVSHASFVIAFNSTRQFSCSSCSRSSMHLLILDLAWIDIEFSYSGGRGRSSSL
jgi:hypothetical protein